MLVDKMKTKPEVRKLYFSIKLNL